MAGSPNIAFDLEKPTGSFPTDRIWPSREETRRRVDLEFLNDFNRDLERNARLSRLNEEYLSRKMEELEGRLPIFVKAHEYTRARLHELLLICAANYANNCEYGAVGDLMFNPRLILVHIKGCLEPVVKERHIGLTEQFMGKAETPLGVKHWLREETILETKKRPLIPLSYERLEKNGFFSEHYLDSLRERAVQIADLSAHLCSMGLEDRLELDKWLNNAGPKDRALLESKLLRIDWKRFRELGSLTMRPDVRPFHPEEKALKGGSKSTLFNPFFASGREFHP